MSTENQQPNPTEQQQTLAPEGSLAPTISNQPLIGGEAAPAAFQPDPTKTPEENAAAEAAHKAAAPEQKPAAAPVEPITADAIKMPEGLVVDEPLMNEFLGLMNDQAKTPAERAQSLIDLQAKVLQQASEKGSAAWDDLQKQWQEEVRNDPLIGGAKLNETLSAANGLVDRYGSPELKSAFELTGIGNNVHFVKFLASIAPLVSAEGKPVSGRPGGGGEVSQAERLYGN